MKRLLVLACLPLAVFGCTRPVPPPAPPSPPPPSSPPVAAIWTDGSKFMTHDGKGLRLVAGCCDNMYTTLDEGADLGGWSCGNHRLVDQVKAAGWNAIYLRPGPFNDVGPEYLRVCEDTARYAETKGILVYWTIFDGWGINLCHGWCKNEIILPLPQDQVDWIRSVVFAAGRNGLFEAANETFKVQGMTPEWERVVRDVIREAQDEVGFPRTPVCSQWYSGERPVLDCLAIGGVFVVPTRRDDVPTILVEDDNGERTVQAWRAAIEAADHEGTYIAAWRGPMGYRQWQDLLALPYNAEFPAHCPPVLASEADGINYHCKNPSPGCPSPAEPSLEMARVFDEGSMAACKATGGVNCVGGTQVPDEMDWDRGYENMFLELHNRGVCAGVHHAPNLHLGVEFGIWYPSISNRIDFFQPLTSDRKWRTTPGAFMSWADRTWIAEQWRPGKRAEWQ